MGIDVRCNRRGDGAGVQSIEEAIDVLRDGRLVLLVDDLQPDRGAKLAAVAETVTPQMINFMTKWGRGLIYVGITEERLSHLQLPLMVPQDSSGGEPFAISVDLDDGTTGISAFDRCATIRHLVNPTARPTDFRRPGHIIPVCVDARGALSRPRHAEASVDLARLSGLHPASVLCEVLNGNGDLAQASDLEKLASQHGLSILPISAVIAHRRRTEKLVDRRAEATLPTDRGPWRVAGYRCVDDRDHLAIVCGEIGSGERVLAHVHKECVVGDVFHSLLCDCGKQLNEALEIVANVGRGVIVYVRNGERRRSEPIGGEALMASLPASVNDEGAHQHGLSSDDLWVGSQVLADLGVTSVLLIENDSEGLGLRDYGLHIEGHVSARLNGGAKHSLIPSRGPREYIATRSM